MGRHALRRGGLAAAVSSLAVAVAAASVVVLSEGGGSAEAAEADTTAITLVDPSTTTPRTDRPYVAGGTGFLHRQTGRAGMQWTDYATGRTVTVEKADGSVYAPSSTCYYIDSECRPAWYGSDGDLVALPSSSVTSSTVTLWDPATATARNLSWPGSTTHGYYRALAGDTVVTTYSLIDKVDGEWQARKVTGDPTAVGSDDVLAADSSGVLWSVDTGRIGYIDVASAVNTNVFADATYASHYVMSEDRIGWYQEGTAELHLKSRADLTAPEQLVKLPAHPGALDGDPVLVGDWLLLPLSSRELGSKLLAVSVTDPSVQQTLLTSAGEYALETADGGALVTGGTDATDWWVQRVSQAEDGTLKLEKVRQAPAVENAKTGIALSRGSLRVAEDDPASTTTDTTSVHTLTTDGSTALTASAATESGSMYGPVCPYAGATCAALWGNLSAEDVYLDLNGGTDEGESLGDDRLKAIGGHYLDFGGQGGAIVDVSDDYAVYNSGGTTPAQYVGEFGQGEKLKRTVRAAALNGSTLWSATTTAGKLTSYSIPLAKTLSTVTVPGLACVPSELQAAGRWVYWACGTDSAGVYDTKAGTSKAVAPGDVLLGDGFTVRHDHATHTLVLTESATGSTRVIASDLAANGLTADRRYRWTVDEYTGLVAWFDDYERTHVTTTGIAPSAVTAFETSAGSYAAPNVPFEADWVLSRPVTSWSLTLTSVQSGATGKATRTLTGGATPDRVSVSWNGKKADGSYFPTGWFKWTLKATGLAAVTENTVTTGEAFLQRGAPVRRDFVSPDGPDGRGDLLTLNSSGGLTFQSGTGTGKFGDKYTGTGWATTVTAVPFGDLSGDRCNDVLVRYTSGALRLYKPGCGAAVKPSTSYTTLATSGWTQYNVLTSPGDVSGDGRPDLIARNSSTGAVYLYKGTSDGKLSARVKLYDNWKGYKKIVGVGDITGDGKPDLLAQDTANTLWRYNGKGDGTFAARVKLFANWGGNYNVVVGVGDITDDGHPDLVSRDTSGNVWRNSGDGKGSFGSRTQIASGWSGYKSLT
ncbi:MULTISPECIES: VCBS repeat-containing protein [unclassified Streptomyces]|uniref:FG-GAP repeat domain-containing protein n=1 Tax=unclassified Streptomyces TaxID=2593676 RepID=UPI00236701EB|nr:MULTISPECIES: VCBS repeat-containing protein [unclassified Streptomyces]MDF3142535.1 VCBS repeat-containing protein [Streptomyces sp. T21Q-yed]WDF39721.1 VCBS repeat-containing protein [Streptomyces sp. T12]